jgi:hypothetical protein
VEAAMAGEMQVAMFLAGACRLSGDCWETRVLKAEYGRDGSGVQMDPGARFHFSCTTLLVRGDGAFYNPPNTAMEAVVPFMSHPGTQPRIITVAHSASECLNIDSHFSNFQEH